MPFDQAVWQAVTRRTVLYHPAAGLSAQRRREKDPAVQVIFYPQVSDKICPDAGWGSGYAVIIRQRQT